MDRRATRFARQHGFNVHEWDRENTGNDRHSLTTPRLAPTCPLDLSIKRATVGVISLLGRFGRTPSPFH